MSLVFIRIDKIGDLIATLPVDQHPSLSTKKIKWVVAKGLGILPNLALPQRQFIEISTDKKIWKKSYRELLGFLKTEQPETVVVFYAPWWVSLACFRAGIPLRVGRLSFWHSLFFNRRLRQSRSQSSKHEADYNQDLLEFGLDLNKQTCAQLQLQTKSNPHLLEKCNLQTGQFVVVHPGMFGSALNWPQKNYNELIEKLLEENIVAITGTRDDERFLTEIKNRWINHPGVRILQDQLSLAELIDLISMSKAVLAPSTGVLHLATCLNKTAIGIYSPILAHHPRRWGPRGNKSKFLLPAVDCPAKSQCLGESCRYFPCMEKISVQEVLQSLEKT